jgi:membrane-bound metal-dependent hydrolase YbcI (DUF457 family)
MMGRTHAAIGVAAWLAVVPAVQATAGLDNGQIALGAALAAGAAMTPDSDCPGSTICRTYGPITNLPARLIAFVARGHRKGTHSLFGIAAFTLLAIWCEDVGGWARWLLLWVLLGVACRALGLAIPRHRSMTAALHALTMAGVTALVVSSGIDTGVVLPAAMAVGCASHVASDMLSDDGCPLAWPFRTRFGVDLLDTGGWIEPAIGAAATLAAVVLAVLLTPADFYLIAVWRAVSS